VKSLLASTAIALLALASPISGPMRFQLGAGAVLAQSPITLQNLAFKGDKASVSIPSIIIDGSSLSRAELEALFDPKAVATLAGRLSQFSARSVTIPAIEITQTLPEGASVSVYRNTVLRDIRNGFVAEAVTDSATNSAKPRQGAKDIPGVEMAMGNIITKGVDMPLWFRFAFDRAQPGETLKLAIAEQTAGRTTYRIGDFATIEIAEISARDIKLRPLKTPPVELLALAERQADDKTTPDAKMGMAIAADMLGAMSFGDMQVKGLTGTVRQTGKPQARFSLDRLAMAGGADVAGRFQMLGLKVENGKDRFNIGEIGLEGVSLAAMMAGFGRLAASTDAAAEPDPSTMIPKIDAIRLAGVDFDVPDVKDPQQRIRARLGLFETKMSNHVGAIPADVAIAIDRLQMDIPADTREKGLQDIVALGYKALDLTARYSQSWSEPEKTLRVNELSVRSAGMFAAQAKAEIVNVPRELFTLDKAVASVAALGVAARSVQISLVNESLFEKLIAKQARESRRKVEDVRAELAAGATIMAPILLGDHPAAKAIGAALGQFVADPRNLKFGITAKGEGLGATDFIAVANPMDLLKKLDITAAANQ